MYRPPVDLEIIRQVKAAVKIPVIGNGDVTTPEEAKYMYDFTGCDLVMVGRGALGAPWLFRQIEEFFATGTYLPTPDVFERMELMVEHVKLICQFKGEHNGMKESRKHAAWYMKGLSCAAALRVETGKLTFLPDINRLAQMACEHNSKLL
jgi:tRNA-dihydrouridine synthase